MITQKLILKKGQACLTFGKIARLILRARSAVATVWGKIDYTNCRGLSGIDLYITIAALCQFRLKISPKFGALFELTKFG